MKAPKKRNVHRGTSPKPSRRAKAVKSPYLPTFEPIVAKIMHEGVRAEFVVLEQYLALKTAYERLKDRTPPKFADLEEQICLNHLGLTAAFRDCLHAIEGMNKTLQTQTAAIQQQNLRLAALDDAISQLGVNRMEESMLGVYRVDLPKVAAIEQHISEQMREG